MAKAPIVARSALDCQAVNELDAVVRALTDLYQSLTVPRLRRADLILEQWKASQDVSTAKHLGLEPPGILADTIRAADHVALIVPQVKDWRSLGGVYSALSHSVSQLHEQASTKMELAENALEIIEEIRKRLPSGSGDQTIHEIIDSAALRVFGSTDSREFRDKFVQHQGYTAALIEWQTSCNLVLDTLLMQIPDQLSEHYESENDAIRAALTSAIQKAPSNSTFSTILASAGAALAVDRAALYTPANTSLRGLVKHHPLMNNLRVLQPPAQHAPPSASGPRVNQLS